MNMLVVVTGHVALQQPPIMLNTLPILKREYPEILMSKVVSYVWELVLETAARYKLGFSRIYLDISLICVKS